MAAKSPQVKLPRAVTVAGLTWRVRRRAKLAQNGEAVDGLCVPKSQEIFIHANALRHIDRARTTLLHEALHAALRSHPQYYDETLIAVLEQGVDELIRLNPDFVEMYGYERRD